MLGGGKSTGQGVRGSSVGAVTDLDKSLPLSGPPFLHFQNEGWYWMSFGTFLLRQKNIQRFSEEMLEPPCLGSDLALLLTLFVPLGNLFKLSASVFSSVKWEYSWDTPHGAL